MIKSKYAHYKYSHNENVFQDTNNLEACYWAGFIASDGHMQRCKGKSDKLVIEISIEDIALLKRLRKFLQYTGPLRFYKNDVILSISSNKICADLQNVFNIKIGNKTFCLKPPNLKDQYALAFVKGAIDGDGGVYTYISNGGPQIYVGNASLEFIKWCHKIMKQFSYVNKKTSKSKVVAFRPTKTNYCNNPSTLYSARISGKFGLNLYKNIKKIKCPGLYRKWKYKYV